LLADFRVERRPVLLRLEDRFVLLLRLDDRFEPPEDFASPF
jgi:hypothetical protein